MTVQSVANVENKRSSHDKPEESMGSLKEFGSKAGTKCNRKKVKMIASDEKTEKELEREFEEEELKCTKAFVLVGGTMTTCTASSRRSKHKFGTEEWKNTRGCWKGASRFQGNGTSGFCDTSTDLRLRTHALHGNNLDEARQESARDALQIHEMEISALTFTLLARGHLVHPGQAVRYCGIRTVRRVLRQRTDLQEIVKE